VRERGVQSRRGRGVEPERVLRSTPPGGRRGGGGSGFWQGLAIVALIAATAGWTTVAVLALRPQPTPVAEASPTDDVGAVPSDDPNASDEPVPDSHTVPALEAQLPTTICGTPLVTQSWTGDATLADDPWSVTVTTFLTSVGKTPVDLQFAQAYDPTAGTDPNTGIDLSIGVFRVAGTEAASLRDNLIKAWKGDYPDLVTTSITIGGKKVTKGDFGADAINSYWYLSGNDVYDVETTDEGLATAALSALPDAAGSPMPSGSQTAKTCPAPVPSGSAPSASPVASPN
jgi:hypothetical protein